MTRNENDKGLRANRLAFPAAPAPREWLMFALFACLVALAYLPSISGPFVYDDIRAIPDNPRVRFHGPLVQGLVNVLPVDRPLTMASLYLNFAAGGLETTGYHAVNVALHLLAGLVFFLLARLTLSLPAVRFPGARAGPAALAASLLWLAHPLNTQAVSYIVQRAAVLAALFGLLSVYGYARFRVAEQGRAKALFLGVSVLAFALALASKQTAILVPALLFLYEWCFFRSGEISWVRRRIPLLAAIILVGLGATAMLARTQPPPDLFWIAAAFTVVIFGPLWGLLREGPKGRTIYWVLLLATLSGLLLWAWKTTNPGPALFNYQGTIQYRMTPGERLLTEFRVVFFYLSLLALPLPSRLSLIHDFPLSAGLLNPWTTLASVLLLAGLLVLSLLRANRNPLFSFALLWFLVSLIPESTVVFLDLVFEHRMYMPSIFLVLWAVAAVARRVSVKPVGAVLFLVLFFLLVPATAVRNRVWSDDIRLWENAASKSPTKSIALNNLGVTRMEHGDVTGAREALSRAVEVNPLDTEAWYNLGVMERKQGNLAGARKYFERALLNRPDFVYAWNRIGETWLVQGEPEKAKQAFLTALTHAPGQAESLNNLGLAELALNKPEAALKAFEEAVRAAPFLALARENLGFSYLRLYLLDKAEDQFRAALESAPASPKALAGLGSVLLSKGRTEEGARYLGQALQASPGDPETMNTLGAALAAQGMDAEAERLFSEAAGILEARIAKDLKTAEKLEANGNPDGARAAEAQARELGGSLALVQKNRGMVLARRGEMEKAGEQLEQARAFLQEDFELLMSLGVVRTGLQDLEAAAEAFGEAARLRPEDFQARKNLGIIYARLGRYREALAELSAARKLNPFDAATDRDLAWVRAHLQGVDPPAGVDTKGPET